VIQSLKRNWNRLKRGRPGHRFEERAERARQNRAKQSWIKRFLEPAVGGLLLAAGVIFCLIPGPGLPLVVIGCALLAQRSMAMARCLDWVEIKVRKLISWSEKWWVKAPFVARVAAVVIGAGVIAGAGYGAYYMAFGR
jgi:hypothetical protein